MLSLWAFVTEADVEAYLATVILPSHLSHLRLGPFRFAAQPENCDGQEPLQVTYVGEGRLEQYALCPKEHALAMIRFVCPGIDTSRIHLPRDDASWHWGMSADQPEKMRIYFAPTTRSLYDSIVAPPSEEAYVSVSRGHVFLGRAVVESYLKAWLEFLGIEAAAIDCDVGTPSAGVEFTAGAVGGQMFLCDEVMAEDLMRFARLDTALTHVSNLVELDMDSAGQDDSGIYEDGIYIKLSQRDGPASNGSLPVTDSDRHRGGGERSGS